MKTKREQQLIVTDQKIRLVDGEFTPNEASDIILALLDQKINFHKLQRLAIWEGDINANTSFPNNRIEELEQEASFWRELIAGLEEKGNHNEQDRMRQALLLVEFKLAQLEDKFH